MTAQCLTLSTCRLVGLHSHKLMRLPGSSAYHTQTLRSLLGDYRSVNELGSLYRRWYLGLRVNLCWNDVHLFMGPRDIEHGVNWQVYLATCLEVIRFQLVAEIYIVPSMFVPVNLIGLRSLTTDPPWFGMLGFDLLGHVSEEDHLLGSAHRTIPSNGYRLKIPAPIVMASTKYHLAHQPQQGIFFPPRGPEQILVHKQ